MDKKIKQINKKGRIRSRLKKGEYEILQEMGFLLIYDKNNIFDIYKSLKEYEDCTK